nr:50S ribosomal protein L30 [bacterium]
MAKVKITLIKSTNGCLQKQKATVEALGLKKIRQSVVHEDNEMIRGMVFRVRHLVTCEPVAE